MCIRNMNLEKTFFSLRFQLKFKTDRTFCNTVLKQKWDLFTCAFSILSIILQRKDFECVKWYLFAGSEIFKTSFLEWDLISNPLTQFISLTISIVKHIIRSNPTLEVSSFKVMLLRSNLSSPLSQSKKVNFQFAESEKKNFLKEKKHLSYSALTISLHFYCDPRVFKLLIGRKKRIKRIVENEIGLTRLDHCLHATFILFFCFFVSSFVVNVGRISWIFLPILVENFLLFLFTIQTVFPRINTIKQRWWIEDVTFKVFFHLQRDIFFQSNNGSNCLFRVSLPIDEEYFSVINGPQKRRRASCLWNNLKGRN